MPNPPATNAIQIRHATADDVEMIFQLLQPYVEAQILLKRDRDDIFQHLQEFLVAERQQQLIGAVCTHIYSKHLAEIRSLAVASSAQQCGVGRELVAACEAQMRILGIEQLFALTYVTDFFLRQGYRIVSKESLPHKIWTVCVHCPHFSNCDEVAVEKAL